MAEKSARNYSDRTLKMLWGRAAGRCAVPSCRVELFIEPTDYDPMVLIGEIAHIKAASDRGPRANKEMPRKERDDYINLILLCKNCHARLDGQKNSNSVESIIQLKQDHEEWVRNSLPERGQSTTGWAVVLLQGQHPFDLEPTITALIPDFPSGKPVIIKADPGVESWDDIHKRLVSQVGILLDSGDPFDFRLAVFPLAPVSACLGLGYYLTNRPRVRLFQYHRDDHSWAWFDESPKPGEIFTTSLPNVPHAESGDIAIRFHLSATIQDEDLKDLGTEFSNVIDIKIPSPNTGWLRSQEQLKDLAGKARRLFEQCLSFYPKASKWHIFYAGPAPGAVAVGQQLNPTMCPPVQFYEFRKGRRPAYQPSLIVGGEA